MNGDLVLKIKEAIENAEAVVIGAGAGLSTAAGFTYGGKRFRENFGDFEEKYGFHDMYSGGFYPYKTLEEYWAFWSRSVILNRYTPPAVPVYEELKKAVENKNYFVITTNVDHCFQRAGFDKERLFYTQGDYGLFQCSKPCHKTTYDNEDIIRAMYAQQKNMKIPSYLVPRCPRCGKPMTLNLRSDNTFVEDEGWRAAALRYEKFLKENGRRRVLFLELGVGYNTPVIIKYPFMRMTLKNPKARYICVNKDEAYIPADLPRALAVPCDLAEVLLTVNL